MNDPKRDQDLAALRDTLPKFWYAMYRGGSEAGFTPEQSFALVQTWILSQNPNGIRPPDGGTTEDKDE